MNNGEEFTSPFEGKFAVPKFYRAKGQIYGRITLHHVTSSRQEWGVFLGWLVFGPALALLGSAGGGVGGLAGYFTGVWLGYKTARKTTVLVIGAETMRINDKKFDITSPVEFKVHYHPKAAESTGRARLDKQGQRIRTVYDRAFLACIEILGQPVIMAEFMDMGEAESLCNRVRGVVNALRRELIKVPAGRTKGEWH